MAKKLLALFAFVILVGIAFLWYLGGQKKDSFITTNYNPQSTTPIQKLPPQDLNQNGEPDWVDELLGSKPKAADEAAVALVNQALQERTTPLLPLEAYSTAPLTVYKEGDLKLTPDAGNEGLANYANQVKEIMLVYQKAGIGQEINLLLAVVEKSDKAALADLTTTAESYRTSVAELLALEAPASAAGLHLNLINTLNRLAEGAAIMSQVEREPVLALSAAQMQTSRVKPVLAAVGNLNIFFIAHNITS